MKPSFAPREVFEQILEYAIIPIFDLVIKYGAVYRYHLIKVF